MKSNAETLRKRGYPTEEDWRRLRENPVETLRRMLSSKEAAERSAAVRTLTEHGEAKDPAFADVLLKMLCREKCLYTRLELCRALEPGGRKTAECMIPYLGRIGNNQYSALPEKPSSKKSYPLPRDIIARTLGKMEHGVLPVLLDVFWNGTESQISEAIDAVGYFLFYHPQYADHEFCGIILDTMDRFSSNNMIVWKCVTCLSAFRTGESTEKLMLLKNQSPSKTIRLEAERSLMLIET